MIDAVRFFTAQFEPVEGGFLYYSSSKKGGKFVSQAEYECLVEGWKSATGGKRFWIMMAGFFAAIVALSTAEDMYGLSALASRASTIVLVCLVVLYLFWESFAPRRLVKNRPEIAPPRSEEENRDLARKSVPWTLVPSFLLLSGVALCFKLYEGPETWADWAWIAGLACLFFLYLRLAVMLWIKPKS